LVRPYTAVTQTEILDHEFDSSVHRLSSVAKQVFMQCNNLSKFIRKSSVDSVHHSCLCYDVSARLYL